MRFIRSILIVSILFLSKVAEAQLTVGQKVPALPLHAFLNNNTGVSNLANLKGKPLLLVFWSKGCASSHEFLWNLNSVIKKVKDINIWLVAMDSESEIRKVLKNKPRLATMQLPFAQKDSALFKLFPHRVTPHVVWIASDGIIKAITHDSLVTSTNLQKLKAGADLHLPLKKEIMNDSLYNLRHPLVSGYFENDNKGVYKFSCLTGRIDGVSNSSGFRVNTKGHSLRLLIVNATVPFLYRFAYQKLYFFHGSRVIIEGLVTSNHIDSVYSYELVLPDTSRNKAFAFMQQDLDRYLGLSSQLEKRKIKVLVLRRTSSLDKFKGEKGKPIDAYYYHGKYILENVPVYAAVNNLFNTGSLFSYPVIDETGINGKISIEICARFSDLKCVNESLEKYDLRLDEEWMEMEVIVLRKATSW